MEPLKAALIALIVVGVVCLGALLLGNKHLCDVSFRSGKTVSSIARKHLFQIPNPVAFVTGFFVSGSSRVACLQWLYCS
ncbi:Hok/Gef family protein [Salmonella enterica]|nr:Hok/Gef family protein [Salmonella enterica]EJM5005971.1 Hok/Gef family protein [Salmonella enterica]EJQ9333002.1 Hok/Gef family protein [Salmonella enterica]EKK6346049.1 Hok/Gef family protein [Salmonella enterica]ELO7822730.1 Hok/Gef family protein [Salmonella enterica]